MTEAPIRVAFCHYTADVCGGSDRSLFDLVSHLPRDRFEPAVILKNGDPMAEEYREAGIEVVQTPMVPPRRALEPKKLLLFFAMYWPTVFRITSAIKKFRADIVHVNTSYNVQGPVAAWLARKPLVWHVREIGEGRLIDNILHWLPRILAARTVAISSAVAETLTNCGPRLRTIVNGIDLSEYENRPDPAELRRELGITQEQPLVVTIGRLETWKGQHVFIEAIPEILREYPNARFAIVGGPAVNKPEYEANLKSRCRELGIEQSVLFTGIRKDVPRILAASDVLVLPTATAEPFGRTVVEAMAAECPVVATAAGGPLDIVVDGETGWLIPTNNAEAIAEKVNHLLSHPEVAAQMGVKGRRRAFEEFSLDRLTSEMASLFEEVARGR